MQSSSTILCLLGLSIAVSAAPASQTTGASGSLQLRATRRQAPAPVGKGAESLNSTTQSTNGDDISSQFEGIMTFNGVPYARCFPSRTPAEAERIDIAIIGAPYDLSVTGRPGARFGPGAIRAASSESDYGYNIFTGRDAFSQGAKIVDCGDVALSWQDKNADIKLLDRAYQRVSQRPPANTSLSTWPRILALGGDHATTISALRATRRTWGEVSVVHIDTHLDTGDGGQGLLLDYTQFDHGSVLHFAHEEGLTSNTSIHAGIHAALSTTPKADYDNDKRCGYEIIPSRDMDRIGASGVIDRIRQRVGQSYVYVSVDIDVLDPAYAPGTGTPVVGGWTSRELLTVLNGLNGLNVVGADVVEVSPSYDDVGKKTSLAAAQVVATLLEMLLAKPVSRAE